MKKLWRFTLSGWCVLFTLVAAMVWAEDGPISEPVLNQTRGCWQYALPSKYQAGPTTVEVLRPAGFESGRRYPVVYILPVEAQGEFRFGDGLLEAQKADLANRLGVICVAPSFSRLPWYGHHATDPRIRQEEFVVRSLVPDIDRRYPTQADAEGRWVFGFSKSGWGAYTLLLRNPETFGYAAAWDAPLMLDGEDHGKGWGPLGIAGVFGEQKTFQQFLVTKLVAENADRLKKRRRLVLGVGIDWKTDVVRMHELLGSLNVPHTYLPNLEVKHRWDTGWLELLAEELAKTARAPQP